MHIEFTPHICIWTWTVHSDISFCWPNESPFKVIHHRLNHHQSGSSSSRRDSVLASEDRHRSGTTSFLTWTAPAAAAADPAIVVLLQELLASQQAIAARLTNVEKNQAHPQLQQHRQAQPAHQPQQAVLQLAGGSAHSMGLDSSPFSASVLNFFMVGVTMVFSLPGAGAT